MGVEDDEAVDDGFWHFTMPGWREVGLTIGAAAILCSRVVMIVMGRRAANDGLGGQR